MAKQPAPSKTPANARRLADDAAKIGEGVVEGAQAAAREGLRTAAKAADTAADQAREGADKLSAQGQAAARRSQQSLRAAASAGGLLAQGSQEISQAWMDLAQERMQHMAEGMRALAACRTPADLMAAQSALMQSAVEQMVDTNRRVAEVSLRVMQEVSERLAAPIAGDPV